MSNSPTGVCDSSVTSPARGAQRLQLALRREERAFAHDPVFRVEKRYTVWKSEVGHPDEVGIRERERHAKPSAVRLAHEARPPLSGAHGLSRAATRPPLARRCAGMETTGSPPRSRVGRKDCGMERRETEPESERSLARELRLVRRRSRLPWVYSVYTTARRQPRAALRTVAAGRRGRRAACCLDADDSPSRRPRRSEPKTRERQLDERAAGSRRRVRDARLPRRRMSRAGRSRRGCPSADGPGA